MIGVLFKFYSGLKHLQVHFTRGLIKAQISKEEKNYNSLKMLQNTLILKMLRQLTMQSLFTDIRPPTKRVLKSSIILSYMVVMPESCIEKMAHFSIGYLPSKMHLIFRGALIKYGTQSVYIKVSCCCSLFRTCSSKLQI